MCWSGVQKKTQKRKTKVYFFGTPFVRFFLTRLQDLGSGPRSGGRPTVLRRVCHFFLGLFVISLNHSQVISKPYNQDRVSSNNKLSASKLQRIFKSSSKTLQEYFKEKTDPPHTVGRPPDQSERRARKKNIKFSGGRSTVWGGSVFSLKYS